MACANFKHLQLDALYVSTQTPGRSAYNPVGRRMAPLSCYLAGIILPFDAFGSHLNGKGETTDMDLEKANFRKAGEVLSEVWSEAVINSYEVKAEWRGEILPQPDYPDYPSQEWIAAHARAS